MQPPVTTPVCPRCGYDLTGIAASWTTHCPLSGTCSECGHHFACFDVYYPDVNDLRGFVEHAQSRRQFALRSLRTWLWALLPNRFWRRVRIEHRIALALMLLWPFALLLALHLLSATLAAILLALENLQLYVGHEAPDFINALTWPLFSFNTWAGRWSPAPIILYSDAARMTAVLLGFHLAWFGTLVLLSDTRRDARIRKAHLARALCYGTAWLLLLPLGRIASLLISLAQMAAGMIGLTTTYWYVEVWTVGDHSVSTAVLLGLWFAAGFLWLTWWWWTAVIRGWRLSLGWLICILLTVIAFLAAMVVGTFPFLFQ